MRARIRFAGRRYVAVPDYLGDRISRAEPARELREHFILAMLEGLFIATLELDANGKIVAT